MVPLTGYTVLVPLDRPAVGENAEQETDDRNALKPKMLKVPREPSESERRLSELTHLPYRGKGGTPCEVESTTISCSEEEGSTTSDPG